jgi:triphosphatase
MVALDKNMRADKAFRLIGWECITQLYFNQALALQGENPEGVHQMRTAIRRLRSAMEIFREVIDKEVSTRFDKELRWIADELGVARDLDVFLTETFPQVMEQFYRNASLLKLHEKAVMAKEKAYVVVRTSIQSRRYQQLLHSLDVWLESMPAGGIQVTVKKIAEKMLRKRYKQLQRRGLSADGATNDRLHRVRITGKKLRYAVEFFGSLYNHNDTRKFLKHLIRLQDTLGALNDIAVTTDLIQKLAGRRPSKDLTDSILIFSGWNGCQRLHKFAEVERLIQAIMLRRPFW